MPHLCHTSRVPLSCLNGPAPSFLKLPQLRPLILGLELLERHYLVSDRSWKHPAWDEWCIKFSYKCLIDTLWCTTCEFDVHSYDLVLCEKLTTKWCDCGCSTSHLGEVCKRTMREDKEEAGKHAGKEREWDE